MSQNIGKRVLIVTTVSGFVPQFEMNNVRILQSLGYEVHYAANFETPYFTNNNDRLNGTGIIRHQIDFARSPYSKQNIAAYRELKKLMNEISFDLVHCHTPVGGAIARLAAKKAHVPYVIYTAHGFHFYKGGPFLYWLLFYPVERRLAHVTDKLITINREDYERACTFHLRNHAKPELVPGIGMNTEERILVSGMREKLNISRDAMILTSVGELSKRKNHKVVFYAVAELKKKYNITYVICGSGALDQELRQLAHDLSIEENIRLLGFRTDVYDILGISDVFVFPSLQEGLPVALMEAMCIGLPVIASKIRGNIDLIDEEKGGFFVESQKIDDYIDKIDKMLGYSESQREKMGLYNKNKIKACDISIVSEIMTRIYSA